MDSFMCADNKGASRLLHRALYIDLCMPVNIKAWYRLRQGVRSYYSGQVMIPCLMNDLGFWQLAVPTSCITLHLLLTVLQLMSLMCCIVLASCVRLYLGCRHLHSCVGQHHMVLQIHAFTVTASAIFGRLPKTQYRCCVISCDLQAGRVLLYGGVLM